MGTYGNLDTYNWTPGFVSANYAECLRILRMLTSLAETLIREKNYPDALIGLKKISIGLIKLENENLGNFDKQIILIALLMPAVAILGILDADAPESHRREAALQYALGMRSNHDHELAACCDIAEEDIGSYIADLRSGAPLEQIKRKYNFPADVFDALRSLEQDLAGPSSYAAPASYSSPSVSSPPRSSASPGSSKSSAGPIGCFAFVLLLAVIAGLLFFRAGPFFSAESPASSDSPQQAEPSQEDPPEAVSFDGFIFPDSDTERIEAWELDALSDSELTYAINEIYARHGYIFRSAELSEYYKQFPWYAGVTPWDF